MRKSVAIVAPCSRGRTNRVQRVRVRIYQITIVLLVISAKSSLDKEIKEAVIR
jgi:hypothetical protein